MADRKVVHPTSQNRVDLMNHPIDRLGTRVSEDGLETSQQGGPLFHLGRIVRPPVALTAPNATELKTNKPKTLPFGEINQTAFVFVERHLEDCQLLAESLANRSKQPIMPSMPID